MSSLPAPVRGIDNRIPLSSNNPDVCIYNYNITPSSYGMKIRQGYREWCIGLDQGALLHVGTIIPFKGSAVGISDDRLFAVTNEGIWDVSTANAPVFAIAFPDTSLTAGYGVFTQYIDDGDNEFIYYADSANGLFIYEKGTDTWTAADPLDFDGFDVTTINFVVVHKLRIWFCTRVSAVAYYLPVGARQGALAPFNYGIKFKSGGRLVGLYNWSVDGGDGLDDFLIAVSSTGDVLPYQGSDPSQSDWKLVGTYFVGAPATGSRCVSQYGGNVLILSTYGITAMSDLLRGVEPRAINQQSYGAAIAQFIREDMRVARDEQGWDIRYLTSEGIICVTVPIEPSRPPRQYVFKTDVDGWGYWRDVPINCVDSFNSNVFFGTKDGRVCIMDVPRDDIKITVPPDTINGKEIDFSILTNYQDLGSPGNFKRGKMIRPNFVSKSPVAFNAKFLYDYDVTEPTINAISPPIFQDQWDIDLWDAAIWNDTSFQIYDRIVGGTGIGRYLAVAIKGQGVSGTRLASIDIFWDRGGGL